MRLLTCALILGLAASTSFGQAAKEAPAKEPQAKLKVGDKAPPFKADKWLQGGPVNELENGKVYVVEFWATWCGPCIVMMPHLGDLAEEYKSKGVTIIGFSSTAQDELTKAEEFVKKRGPKLGYNFAWGNSDANHKAWMTAAEQGGIPCSFVVNKEGTIVYIGHPMWLDEVLPKVVAGTWDVKKGPEELEAAEKDFEKAYKATQNKDAAAALKEFQAVIDARPSMKSVPYLMTPWLDLLVKNKQVQEAAAIAEKALAKATKRDDAMARMIRGSFMNEQAKASKELVAIAVKASEMDREMTGATDAGATVRLAEAYSAAGEADKAKKVASEGVTLAEKAIKGEKDWQGQLLLASANDVAGNKQGAKAAAQKAVEIAEAQKQQGLTNYVLNQAKKFGAEATPKKEEEKK